MYRILSIPLVSIFLLSGCGDPSANAPMLNLTIESPNGNSTGRYRVFHTGLIAGSGDHSDDGSGMSKTVTIDKIEDNGVRVTVAITDSDGGKSTKQMLVPYDQEITVPIAESAKVTAYLERKK